MAAAKKEEKIVVEYVRVSKTGNPNDDRKRVPFDRIKDAYEWVNSLKQFDGETTYTDFNIIS